MADPQDYRIDLRTISRGYDRKTCWVQTRVGVIPAASHGAEPTAVATTQKLLLSGSDIFYGIHSTISRDRAATWSPITEQPGFRRQREGDTETVVCDFWPQYHHASGTLLGTGHTAYYVNNALPHGNRPRSAAYATFDDKAMQWRSWRKLEMPEEGVGEQNLFYNGGAGCTQRVDLPDGDILLPIYTRIPASGKYGCVVVRCSFDGEELRYKDRSNLLTIDQGRGLYEPSLALFEGEFFLTMRNDSSAYVARSRDGRHFDDPVEWRFDNGEVLGSYNTQAHWVTRSDALYLVYTRRGLNNDHVFRHRAPLVMGHVNPADLRVHRESERIVVPERGARLGNYGITPVSDDEVWVVTSEWMQTTGPDAHDFTVCEKYGSDNTLWVARLLWS